MDWMGGNPNRLIVSPEKLIGKSVHDILPEEVAKKFQHAIDQVIGGEPFFHIDYQLEIEGEVFYFSANFSSPSPDTAIMLVRDITERIRAEAALAEQRTKAVGAAKMAMLGEMSGGVAHEINNPLAIIHGKAFHIRRWIEKGQIQPNRVLDALTRIIDTCERISNIVKSMRAIAKDGAQEPPVRTSARSIITNSLDLCRSRIESHRTEIRLGDVDPQVLVSCRPPQIAQVLLNLLGNADQATYKLDTRWVEVDAQVVGDFVEFRVTDSGSGISKEIQEKVMQPFFTTQEIGSGMGLGLSVSKSFVEEAGGNLWLDTSAKNTTFKFTIPLAQSKASAA